MADEGIGEPFELGAVCDEEARRWQDYAERWGTDQYDEGSRRSTGVSYVDLVYMAASVPIRIWLVLVDLGLVD